ncbi:nuclear transport factor 2 family protein [Natronococcus occultus]|uniref:SnoaL-like domain-containing protein n=1 Tax=Natronococcus occultus SP4 TaxID=694430 RepID=L0K2F3_9EURY|nr:nuclear transport factor 2 family protein [Natronococcus occultus]AGB38730.1 hypothetical protein Natoc_2975 [Natronococcus occultus SP4]
MLQQVKVLQEMDPCDCTTQWNMWYPPMAEAIPAEVQELLDKQAISELIHKLLYLSDENDWDAGFELVTDDVIAETPYGSADGKDDFRELSEEIFAEFQFSRHMLHNGLIEIDGGKATGKWYGEIPILTTDGEAEWILGIYEHEFRRVDGEWKLSKYTFDPTYVTPYDEGWAEQPFPEEMPVEPDW